MSEENHDQCSFVSIHYIICECGETFPSEDALKAHLEKEHPHKRERKEYKCGVCSNIYSTEAECIQHYEARHLSDGFNLDHCENEDPDEYADDKKLLLEVEVGDMEGEVPPEEVALEEAIEAIEAIKQESLEEDDKKLLLEEEVGDMEGELPPEEVALEEAFEVIEAIKQESLEGEIPEEGATVVIENPKPIKKVRKTNRQIKNQRSIVCEVCGKYYASNAALRYHQRTHTGERPYQCSFCPKTFAMPLFLQIHVRTHTGEKPYQCPACPKAFSNKAALLRHDRVHSGEKPYKCPVCDKSFTQSNSMKLHVTTVHLKQPTPYKSKNRRLLAEERSQTNIKSLLNPRRKIANNINSVDVLKNGLEAYVLGPLKADLENLKADIDMLSRGELEEFTSSSIRTEKAFEMQDSIMFEVKDNVYEVIEEVLYEDVDGNCVVVSNH